MSGRFSPRFIYLTLFRFPHILIRTNCREGSLLEPDVFNRKLIDWLVRYNADRAHRAFKNLMSPAQYMMFLRPSQFPQVVQESKIGRPYAFACQFFMQNTMAVKQNTKIDEIKSQKPYFENDKISIFKEDILKITAIPENSVDL